MARQVDHVWLPERISGHPALELNNTVGGWGFEEPREYLVDYRALMILSRDLDLIDADESAALLELADRQTGLAEDALHDVKRLRETAHAVLLGASAPAAEQLHGFVSAAIRESRYRRAADGSLRLDGGDGLRRPVHRFALTLHSLLAQYPGTAIRPCADERCGWVFLDPSGRRRWCEMSVCGNRAKARRYAQRHRVR
jgi:predicted RNA-binding Zn ribbon-like protein